MSSFDDSKGQFSQEHFTIIEIDLPVVNGACTISGEPGYGTPLSCDQASNGIKTYKFTDYGGVLPESNIHKCLKKVTESPTKLQLGTGLAKRGTMTVTLADFIGVDPNPTAPAVTQEVINQGTFLGKIDARYILTNNLARRKDYRVEADGTIDLINGARTSYFIIDTFAQNKNGDWTLNLKDELAKTNLGESVWPILQEGYLRADINNSETTFQVDPNINYQIDQVIRLGDELCRISSISNIQTPSAEIGVYIRNGSITFTNFLSKTRASEHSAGDEIYICEVADNERVDDLAKRILEDVGIDSARIPISDWNAEIDEWNIPNLNTVFVESLDTSDVLNSILIPRQLNQWFDPIDREVKLTAINAWVESTFSAQEGVEINDNAVIDFNSVTLTKQENLRATRAIITYDKPYLTDSDDFQYYKKASIASRTGLETTDFFGIEPKWKQFDPSPNIDKDTADLLVSRYVQRNSNPHSLKWTSQESKINFKVGDVGDIKTLNVMGFSGLSSTNSRGQITSIKPVDKGFGREYECEALFYEPSLSTGTEIVITGNTENVNLYIQYAGAPSQPVELTFVFDGTKCGSTSGDTVSIRAGGFPVGSKLIIILANGAELLAKGGDGGFGGVIVGELQAIAPNDGKKGATVFDAEGIDCDIYFSGATPSANYPTADGYILAPSGGNGGFSSNFAIPQGGAGGNGGDGNLPGLGGPAGADNEEGDVTNSNGINGTSNISTGVFGMDGANNNAFGGAKGKGVVDSGATVTFFGSSAARYVNGGGDH